MAYTTNDTYESLKASKEGRQLITPDGREYAMVYLDNARLPEQTMSQFRAHLAALSKKGLYKPYDDEWFGWVLL
jgi:hypothetical protein